MDFLWLRSKNLVQKFSSELNLLSLTKCNKLNKKSTQLALKEGQTFICKKYCIDCRRKLHSITSERLKALMENHHLFIPRFFCLFDETFSKILVVKDTKMN